MNQRTTPHVRAAIYSRVSTDDQAKHGYSLPSQLEACQKYAEEHGWTVVECVSDEGVSGATLDRPGLDRIQDMAAAGEIDILIVYELDRLARRTVYQMLIEEELGKAGVTIHYVLGDYDDSDEGRLQKQIRAAIAEYERAKIQERMNRGKRQRVRSGKVIVHGRPPYGYQVEDGMLVPFEPEARTVRLIFDWYTRERLAIRAIVRELNKLNLPTAADSPDRKGIVKQQKRGRWARSSVNRILANETYVGTWHYQKLRREGNRLQPRPREEWIAVEVPALVSRKEWEAAQERRRKNREQARRNRKHQYLLSGCILCGRCGARTYSYPSKGYLFYVCSRRRGEVLGEKCDLPIFSADQVDAVVWDYLRSLLLDSSSLKAGLKKQQAEHMKATQPLRDRLEILENLLKEHRSQLERLLDLYLVGEFTKEMLTERKCRLESTIQGLEEERANLQAQVEATTISDDQIRTIDEFARQIRTSLQVAEADFETRRKIVDLLDVQVTLATEDEEKVAYVRCLMNNTTIAIAPTTLACRGHNSTRVLSGDGSSSIEPTTSRRCALLV